MTSTADLCDDGSRRAAGRAWIRYGGVPSVDADIETVRAGDSKRIVREVLDEPGAGRVLVVDGPGEHGVALLLAGRWVHPGARLAADGDGVVVG